MIEMDPYLQRETMSDEELFEKLNACVSNKVKLPQKFGSQVTPKVNTVQEGGDKQTKKKPELDQALVKELKWCEASGHFMRECTPQFSPCSLAGF